MRNISENIDSRFNLSEKRAENVANSMSMTSKKVSALIASSGNVVAFG